MPYVSARDGLRIHYHVDDFTDPWTEPETIVLVHGVAEGSWSWYAWVPHLARHYRVVRPDLRGHGPSDEPPAGYQWNLDDFCADVASVLDDVGAPEAHVVSARFGATIGPVFAALYPQRVRTLTAMAGVFRIQAGPLDYSAWPKEVAEQGVEHWAHRTQIDRLGERDTPRARYWTRRMSETPQRTVFDLLTVLPHVDIGSYLPKIEAPTLLMTASRGRLQDLDAVRQFQQTVPQSELRIVESEAYHVAATQADDLAEVTLEFIRAHGGRG